MRSRLPLQFAIGMACSIVSALCLSFAGYYYLSDAAGQAKFQNSVLGLAVMAGAFFAFVMALYTLPYFIWRIQLSQHGIEAGDRFGRRFTVAYADLTELSHEAIWDMNMIAFADRQGRKGYIPCALANFPELMMQLTRRAKQLEMPEQQQHQTAL